MERLTHEADFGVEDWEQILYRVPADPEGAYNIFDIAERWVRGCRCQSRTYRRRCGRQEPKRGRMQRRRHSNRQRKF